ncbi:MAG: polyprenyl synthetase family protein [Aeromicrobium sp.]
MTTTETDFVEERLASVHQAVRRSMLDAIPDAEPHHWLYRVTRSYPSRPGKALRPALCLAAAGAFGGDASEAMPAAVAIELLHNAFLVHDDIVDGSQIRRGRPTLSAEYGTALALNAGDALAVLANRVLRHYTQSLDRDLGERLQREFDGMALRTLEGQATELGWRHDDVRDLTPEHYLDLIMHKTCWYTSIHPLRVGALLGSKGTADLRPMVRFGFHLGAAFQIQDDLLNLEGDEDEYGKEIDGDLFEGKRTLPLIHLMTSVTGADRATVDHYLGLERADRSPELVGEIRALLDVHGSIDYARAYAQGIADTAVDAFEAAFASAQPGPDVEFIRALISYMIGRRS